MAKEGAIWLDHAASSWPKPPTVFEAVRRWFDELGVDAQRGSTPRHDTVRREVLACRRALGELCAVPDYRVIFCSGATEALNLVIQGVVERGDLVWSTALEHNAVARCLHAIGARVEELDIDAERAPVGPDLDDPHGLLARLDACAAEDVPKLLVYNHVSNVTGARIDLSYAAGALRARGCTIAVDCAQSAGRLALDVLDADALAIPGHKGLQGPPGLGVLVLKREVELQPARFGGTGSSAPSVEMPAERPAAFEAGTPNTPAILGLAAGLRWVNARGIDTIHQHELAMVARMRRELADLEADGQLRCFGGVDTGVLALDFRDFDVHEVSMALASDEIFTRAGFHCTARIHAQLGADGGTLRISPGPDTRDDEIDRAAACIRELIA